MSRKNFAVEHRTGVLGTVSGEQEVAYTEYLCRVKDDLFMIFRVTGSGVLSDGAYTYGYMPIFGWKKYLSWKDELNGKVSFKIHETAQAARDTMPWWVTRPGGGDYEQTDMNGRFAKRINFPLIETEAQLEEYKDEITREFDELRRQYQDWQTYGGRW